ncbi:MAG: MarR family transcriptional regulator [Sphingomonadales bacterium]
MPDRAAPLALDSHIFLGRAAEQLSSLIEEQSEFVFRKNGIVIPVKSCSLITVLADLGSATASDIARTLKVSHQLVLQKLPKLLKLGLVEEGEDPQDGRKRTFSLTADGMIQLKRFQACCDLILGAYDELFAEVGDIFHLTSKAIAALGERTIDQRIAARAAVK